MAEFWASQLIVVAGHMTGAPERDRAVILGAAAFLRNQLVDAADAAILMAQATLGEVEVSKTSGAGSTPDVCADGAG